MSRWSLREQEGMEEEDGHFGLALRAGHEASGSPLHDLSTFRELRSRDGAFLDGFCMRRVSLEKI